MLEQFRDEGGLFTLNFRADLGEFLFLASRPREGERVLRQLIEDEPDSAIGYARLATLLGYPSLGPRRWRTDLPAAIALLEAAIAQPVADLEHWDLSRQLAELRGRAEP